LSVKGRKRASIRTELMSAYKAYQRREPGSMDQLLALVRKFVYMKLYHLEHDFKDFGSAETVDDWTQDVSIRVWQSLLQSDKRSPASFYAWVHKIAFNEGNAAFNKLEAERAGHVSLFVYSEEGEQDGDGEHYQEENPALHEEGHGGSSIHIPASVTGVDRDICNLLLTTIRTEKDGRHRGRNYAEVGQVLGITEQAVKDRLWKMRKRLKAEREARPTVK
jgi:DNA-directed RNA polymerase specialized sigma24 family protein